MKKEEEKSLQGRKPINIITSVPFSQILFLISNKKNYAQIISKERKTDPSSTLKQLEKLRDQKFLLKPQKENLLWKTVYEINWEKIIIEFLRFLKKRNEQVENKADITKNYPREMIATFGLSEENNLIEKYKNNEYLLFLIKELFKKSSNYDDLSINELFDWIIKIHPNKILKEVENKTELLESNNSLKDYITLIRVCSELSSQYIGKDIKKISHLILKKINEENNQVK